jgi:hypothetical protein
MSALAGIETIPLDRPLIALAVVVGILLFALGLHLRRRS